MSYVDSSNEGMTLSEFKRIFYMEYAHRMWGRSIGAVFFLPAVFFAYKGWITKSLKPRLFIYGGLLAFQVNCNWKRWLPLIHSVY
jgi:cytochrome c oxidase assembly protein subunit 15